MASGTPMQTVLSPKQCEEMRSFLRYLVTARNQGNNASVNRLMMEYKNAVHGYYFYAAKTAHRRQSSTGA